MPTRKRDPVMSLGEHMHLTYGWELIHDYSNGLSVLRGPGGVGVCTLRRVGPPGSSEHVLSVHAADGWNDHVVSSSDEAEGVARRMYP
jgi:hypothetical protein